MGQIFHRSSNTISKVSLFGGLLLLVFLGHISITIFRSPFMTQVNIARDQPVPFSHKHHVGGVGIDCRFCHTSVEQSSFAGIPSTEICMKCHSVIWNDSPTLAPVRESFQTGKSLAWTRVHDLPDFVYFDHSIHVAKGIGCVSCHGQVDRMPLTWKVNTLHMEWCLNCHRHPEDFVRPKDEVFNMNWVSKNQKEEGQELVKTYNIKNMTNCSTCHR